MLIVFDSSSVLAHQRLERLLTGHGYELEWAPDLLSCTVCETPTKPE